MPATADSLQWINAAIIPVAAAAEAALAVAVTVAVAGGVASHVEWRVHLIYPIKVFAINPVKAND